MADLTPTRSLAIALADERRTMREGYAFLDEKCLLLAGEMLRELRHWQRRRSDWRRALSAARRALRAAVARHGLQGLSIYPAEVASTGLERRLRLLLGVPTQSAALAPTPSPPASAKSLAATALQPTPEAEACRRAYAELLPLAVELAALSGNLARLYAEYRRTVRRVRALQDVLLPEVEALIADIEASLEALEQDEAAVLRSLATGR